MEWSVFSIVDLISFEAGPFSSIGSRGSAHASLWEATGIVSSGKSVEIVVLEGLFIFGTLHEFWYRVLNRSVSRGQRLGKENDLHWP